MMATIPAWTTDDAENEMSKFIDHKVSSPNFRYSNRDTGTNYMSLYL